MNRKIIVALDVSSRDQALHLVRELHDLVGMFKVGSQLFVSQGPALVREILEMGGKVFLDLKFNDIPNTVTHAAIEAAKLGVSMMTVHAGGGRSMMQAVMKALKEKGESARPIVVAVTVLTSLDTRSLFEMGIEQAVELQVERLALLAQECGVDGVVCSPREIQALRKVVNPAFKIVTPGIRLPDQPADDQQRHATPRDAFASGADYIVVGRAVTDDRNARESMQRLIQSI